MESLLEHYPTLRTLWLVWFFVLFVGIVVWVLRPSRKRHYEEMGSIPLRDDDVAQGGR